MSYRTVYPSWDCPAVVCHFCLCIPSYVHQHLHSLDYQNFVQLSYSIFYLSLDHVLMLQGFIQRITICSFRIWYFLFLTRASCKFSWKKFPLYLFRKKIFFLPLKQIESGKIRNRDLFCSGKFLARRLSILPIRQLEPQSRQSAKLFLLSSELGLPQPLTRRRVCPPPGSGGRGTVAGERGVGRVPIPTWGQTLWYSLHIRTLWLEHW
jgi:hypothetical protein